MKLSRIYSEHSAELRAIVGYLQTDSGAPSDNALRLGVSAAEVASLAALRADFDAAYMAYSHPDSRTSVAVQKMRAADGAAYSAVLPLRQRLKHGAAALTSADYAELGIHEDKKTRTRAKTPEYVLHLILVKASPLYLVFEAKSDSGEHGRRYVLPKDWRIAREVAILPQGAKPAEGDFRAIDSVGRVRFGISFAASQVGMNVYLRIAAENRAGRGPFSQPIRAIVI